MPSTLPSLSRQLVTRIAIAMLILVAGITLTATWMASSNMDALVTGQTLPAQLREVRNRLDAIIQGPVITSAAMANNHYAQRFLVNKETEAEQEDFRRYLAGVKTSSEAVSAFLIATESLHYYTHDGLFKTLDRNNPRDGWFFGFLNSNLTYELNLDVDEISKRLTLFVNHIVKIDGRIVAVTGIGKGVDEMADLIRNVNVGEAGRAFVVNNKGDIMVHRDTALIGKPLATDLAALASLQKMLLNNNDATVLTVDDDSGEYFVTSAALQGSGLHVIALQPVAETRTAITRMMLLIIGIATLLTVLSLFAIAALSRQLVSPVRHAAEALHDIGRGGGDLRQRLSASDHQETALLADGFNQFATSLQSIIKDVMQVATHVAEDANQLVTHVGNASGQANQQQMKLELVATAVNEMGATVQEIARNAADAAQSAKKAEHEAGSGRQVVNDTVSAIDRLAAGIGESTESITRLASDVTAISQVLDVIRGISEQTNLLALNAAIEAARAGDQGRGFAVVADEVRSLAQRTQQSTEEIRQTMERLQSNAERAVASMERGRAGLAETVQQSKKAEDSLRQIHDAVDQISSMNYQIATATEEQSTVTEDISSNVTIIATLARDTAAVASQSQNACSRLKESADRLDSLMASFKV